MWIVNKPGLFHFASDLLGAPLRLRAFLAGYERSGPTTLSRRESAATAFGLWLCCFALLLLFQAPAMAQSSGQTSVTLATTFPDKLLEGMKNFNMAILLQGDIRGNFGPCG
jgi:hypothetical protein